MKLYFVRHGQTNYNAEGDLVNSDPSKDVHLTELGKSQAKAVAEKLKDKKLDVIFISRLPRTRETANFINSYHSSPIKIDSRLDDRNTGMEGKPYKDFVEAVKENTFSIKIGDGESFYELKDRVFSFLKDLKKMNFENVLVVSHGEPLKVIIGYFKNFTDQEICSLDVKNCQIEKFEL